jgi:hypothetical protein
LSFMLVRRMVARNRVGLAALMAAASVLYILAVGELPSPAGPRSGSWRPACSGALPALATRLPAC